MFGYITADRSQMTEEQLARYSGCYCGLCRTLNQRHGLLGRMTLNYDMTFLVLVLTSLYEPTELGGESRCPVHPLKKRGYWTSEFSGYGADMNLYLAWLNCLDNWQDDKSLPNLALYKLLDEKCRQIEARYPRQTGAIQAALKDLSRYEAGESVSADMAAERFGDLMGELFAVREEDHWAPTLRRLGQGLGRFIYILDACIDYEADRKKGRPNPLLALDAGERDREGDYALLSMLLSDAAAAFEHLPLVQDAELMRNILYAGVWQRYHQAFPKKKETKAEMGESEHD